VSTPVYDINKKYVAVLKGAASELVTHRELRNSYKTNRSIKTWATYFLLKSLTTSGHISNWTAQKADLLDYCKMTENCFRARLRELQTLKLITVAKKNRNIELTSFTTAAEILGIEYAGTIKIEYNDKQPGQNIFPILPSNG